VIRRLEFGFFVIVALLLVGAMVDDGRFWLRYLHRVPAFVGIPGAASANALPDLRADIPAAAPAALRLCVDTPALKAALAAADGWLEPRKTDAFLVWHGGCLAHERYFTGDAATPRSAGAMAKSLEAIAVGRAIRLGRIASMDTPVAGVLPEWRGDARAKIRYRDLMAMHAGLQFYRLTQSPFEDFQRISLGSDYAPRALALRAVAPPGTIYDYSAWTYDILGIALARAVGERYENFVARQISAPLGLGPMTIYVDRPGGTVHANCCLFGRADDWIKLGALLVAEAHQPALLPPGFVAAMARPGVDQRNYGMGVWLGSPYAPVRTIASPRNPYPTPIKTVVHQSQPFLADDVLIFEGVGQTKVWIVPSRDLVIARFGKAAKDWDDAVVPNLIMEALSR
jgi:CubicO group peptidase (beta-lactamase class C family)